MKNRIKQLRKELGLTQEAFGNKIGIKRNSIANYEIGRNNPIDAVIFSICRTFSVNETWLRTGEGEMFVKPENHYTSNLIKLSRNENPTVQAMITAIANTPPDELEVIMKFVNRLTDKKES